MGLFKGKKIDIDMNRLPNHIAFIIDGNGRWAKGKGLPRKFGHKVGVDKIEETVKNCLDLGLRQISFYCFSTENWNRPKDEVDTIFELLREFLSKNLDDYVNQGIKVYVSGDISKFKEDLQEKILNIVDKTKNNDKLKVNICLNYGGRSEIVRAVNNIIKSGEKSIDENSFKKYLYTSELTDPDLIVRTSGEYRISNFMLYQLAYSEFYFPKVLWPDFNKKELLLAINNFQSRKRRFGSIKE